MVLDVIRRLLHNDIDRAEVAAWARGYAELIDNHAARFEPKEHTQVLMDAVVDLAGADLRIDEDWVLDQAVLRHLFVRLSQGVVVQ